MTKLTSAAVPEVGPDDHVRGEGTEAIVYLDLACPHCAASWPRLVRGRLRMVFRHFPVASKHPRAPALHAAAEAVALQRASAFWDFVDSVYADQGRIDDPHLWARVRSLELDLERFENDRRADDVTERVRRDFGGGIRAGVTGTPAVFIDGAQVSGGEVGTTPL